MIRNSIGLVLAFLVILPSWSQVPAPGTAFRDCPECPEMVVIPAGSFVMGSPETETGRDKDETPQHNVAIGYSFAVGRYEVTRAQYAQFLREAGHAPAPGNCWYWDGDEGKAKNDDPSRSWTNPGFPQEDSHPAVCVSWEDAKAYVAWLSRKTGKNYRLLTEAEWEYSARAGSSAARPWGEDRNQACIYANVGDLARTRIVPPGKGRRWAQFHDCDDRYGYTAPVGSYTVNRFGLYDMIGNVWEWTEDCWNESYAGAPADGSAWRTGDCARRVARGGSWYVDPRYARSANRAWDSAGGRVGIGFRLARTF